MSRSFGRTSAAIMVILCGIMFIACGGKGDKDKGDGGQAKEGGKGNDGGKPVEAIKVSAEEMYKAYKENEVSANQKYKDKVVELTGTIHAVKEKYIELNEDNSPITFGLVHVHLEGKSKDKMASLIKGQTIKVRGTCTGKVGAVNVKKAELLE